MPLLDLDLYRKEVAVAQNPQVRLSVVDAGPRPAEHTLLFIHGFGGQVMQWEKQLTPFAETYRVVGIELRGHALSDHPASTYSMDELVADVEHVVQILLLPEKFILLGHSFGGAIAATYAARHPERVEKLVLIGVAANFNLGAPTDWMSRLPAEFAEPLRPYLPVKYNAPFFVMKTMYRNAMRVWDGARILPQVQAPTLIILGTRDLTYKGEAYETVADLIPNAQIAKIPVSAHMVHLERAEAVNRAIERFIGVESVSWRERRRAARTQMLRQRPWLQNYDDLVPHSLTYPTQPLTRFLDTAARRYPHQPAILFEDGSLTYRALKRAANRFSNSLIALGVRRGDRVALLLPNSPQFVIAYYGALKAGAVVVSIYPRLDAAEVTRHLADSGAETLVTLYSSFNFVEQLQPNTRVQSLILTSLEEYLPISRKIRKSLTNFAPPEDHSRALKTAGVFDLQKLLGQASKETPVVEVRSDDLALIQYSTGTTDLPKGVMLTHANLVANTVQLRHWMAEVDEGQEKILIALPLSHSYAMTTGMNFAIAVASAMILLPAYTTGELLETIARTRPTIFPGVPMNYVAINHYPNARRYGLKSIRACLSGAAPLPLEVQEAFEKVTRGKLVEGYGLTEASPVTHANPIYGESKSGAIGLPLPDTDARIVDPKTGAESPIETIGELVVRGPQVMRGYWNLAEQTAAALNDGWLYTGDMARMDDEGYFQFIDRKSDLIEIGGITIYPRDIEEVLYEHPKVFEAAVVSIPTAFGNACIKAFIVLQSGEQATREEILAFARARLPAQSMPREVEFRADLPKTLVGKVFKRKLIEEEKLTTGDRL